MVCDLINCASIKTLSNGVWRASGLGNTSRCWEGGMPAASLPLDFVAPGLALYISFIICSSDVQDGFRKGGGTRDQIANTRWIIKKAREFQKNIYFCFIDYTKDFDCVDHNKMWKILKEMRISDHLTCLLRNLYAGQEGTVRTGH